MLEDGTPHDRLGGLGSAIAYAGAGDRYLMVPDRGPADGATTYVDRFHALDITVNPTAGMVTPSVLDTTLLRNESGQIFTGSSGAFDSTNSPNSLRFDPEGARVGRTGSLFVSDEYDPFVHEFDQEGRRLRSISVPDKFLIANPNATGSRELPPNNVLGRQANRGMEGLAITPDGERLYGIMQSPLIQDGGLNASNSRVGLNTRILEMNTATGATREFLYQLDHRANGISEILAINEGEFLVLERDGRAGTAAESKKLFHISLAGATDISHIGNTPITGLPTSGAPAGVTPVSKNVFLDFLNPVYGLAGPDFPEKLEGLAFGPDLTDGRRLLMVTSDNDFFATQPTRFFAFAIDGGDLPGFQAQSIIPEPGAWLLFSSGLVMVMVALVIRRHRSQSQEAADGR